MKFFTVRRKEPRFIQMIGSVTNGGRRHEISDEIKMFNEAADRLRKRFPKAIVYNPVDFQRKGAKWHHYMADCIETLFVDKPVIYYLPNWKESQGARLEMEIARQIGLEIRRVK